MSVTLLQHSAERQEQHKYSPLHWFLTSNRYQCGEGTWLHRPSTVVYISLQLRIHTGLHTDQGPLELFSAMTLELQHVHHSLADRIEGDSSMLLMVSQVSFR